MRQSISQLSLLVADYDEAIAFYTEKLNFILKEDSKISNEKRWVVVSPPNSECSLLLAKASNEIQIKSIGNQTGGRVFLFLNTNDFERDYENLLANNIKIIRGPISESYGKVLVFEDLYGNLWDLIEPKENETSLFYSTAILKIKNENEIDFALSEIKKLKKETQNEIENITFEIQQSKEDELIIVVWECFKSEEAFNNHLKSNHLHEFMKLDLFEFLNGYSASIIK
ncbi:VOC family protein [Flavobacterium sp. SUN052]|uniref:VOC family protein n=1 Tax=Flavobacterium sp. SUN052 TaxID=3002441 RepID=UPI00237ECE28|nr:VOC family protein [Flavobacterium sp. SUN052]MEC4003220.1 VOC family protein [Flavobacterium sp. SUN052]